MIVPSPSSIPRAGEKQTHSIIEGRILIVFQRLFDPLLTQVPVRDHQYPTTPNAIPMTSNGQTAPLDNSGMSLPAARLTAIVVSPVRHHAR